MLLDKEKLKKDFLRKSNELNEQDLLDILNKKDEIIFKVCNNFDLKDFIEDINIFFMMVEDYINNRCNVSFNTIQKIVWTLFYIGDNLDNICDDIPVVGYIDDAFVVNLCLDSIKNEIEDYKSRCLKG